jgi:hypothetical protein
MEYEPKPWTLVRAEYWPIYAKECGADAVQLELNIKWLIEHGHAKEDIQ